MAGNADYMDWMGVRTYTLKDLLRPGLRAVIVGINPSPVSVDSGHYYQGSLGQRLFGRLKSIGILSDGLGWEDDLAFESGIGFTDLVKRPSPSAAEVSKAEKEHGRELLFQKLGTTQPKLIVFSFKDTATTCLGNFRGNGLISTMISGVRCFVMPGPYESASTTEPTLASLATILKHN